MMDPFQRMHDSVSRRLGTDAVYTPPSGAPVPCRITPRQPDADWRTGDSGVTSTARVAEVRVSEVPVMEEEGVLAIGGESFVIQKASRPDADRLLWRLELR
jgi:hypothetical protein